MDNCHLTRRRFGHGGVPCGVTNVRDVLLPAKASTQATGWSFFLMLLAPGIVSLIFSRDEEKQMLPFGVATPETDAPALSFLPSVVPVLWLVCVLWWYRTYSTQYVETPRLRFRENIRNGRVFRLLEGRLQGFSPSPWAVGPHIQSFMFAYWPFKYLLPKYSVQYERELIEYEDGGIGALDWHNKPTRETCQPIVVLLPGAVGSSQNIYAQRFCMTVGELGWSVAVKSWRGINVEMKKALPETWDAQSVADLDWIVGKLKTEYPDAPLLGYGFSLGGVVLQGYFGRFPSGKCLMQAGVSLSGLFDVEKIPNIIGGRKFPPYDFAVTYSVRRDMQTHAPILETVLGSNLTARLSKLVRIRDYHDLVTRHFSAPPSSGIDDFLRRMGQYHLSNIPSVTSPLLCIMAEDDPLCPPEAVQVAKAESLRSHGVFLLETRRGGHCGWFEGVAGRSWADAMAIQFCRSVLESS